MFNSLLLFCTYLGCNIWDGCRYRGNLRGLDW